MPTASAPGKFILFGEHAVVYGKPAIAMAIDMRTRVDAEFSSRTTVDGKPLKDVKSYYIKEMMRRWRGKPISVAIKGGVPPSSGLGSSASLSVSMMAALFALDGDRDVHRVASEAFDVEYTVQGGASPTDTSTSALGGAVMVGGEQEDYLWELSKGEKRWKIGRINPPEMDFVIGVTRVHSPTKVMVQKVKKKIEREPETMEFIDEIGELVKESVNYLKHGKRDEIGALMNRNHELLKKLGVSCREIEAARDAVKSASYGVKLTGAGGGGSIVALTENPEEVKKALEKQGCRAYIVRPDSEGVRWD